MHPSLWGSALPPLSKGAKPSRAAQATGKESQHALQKRQNQGAWERGLGASCWQFGCISPTGEFPSVKEDGICLGEGVSVAPLGKAGAKYQMKTICFILPACVSVGYEKQQMRNIKFPSFVPHKGTNKVSDQWFSGPL